MFQLAPKGRQRISQNEVVRETVPELGSGDQEGLTTREISDEEEWAKVSWRASMARPML